MKMWIYHPDNLPKAINTWERKRYPDWADAPYKADPAPEPEPTPELVMPHIETPEETKARMDKWWSMA